VSTAIQWTDETWNPVVGCTQVSPGCAHCYAKSLHDTRHKASLGGKAMAVQYAHPFEVVQLKPERLSHPLSWKKPRRVFVNSVSDLFHDDVPDEYILRVWHIMAQAERHTFQVLTKRPARMLRWFEEYLPEACSGESPAETWPLPNVWIGVSVENQRFADERIPLRFLSCEPLLSRVDLTGWISQDEDPTLGDLQWCIIGGESGKDARTFRLEWAESLIEQCRAASVPVFMKQIGARAFSGCVIPLPYSIGGHGDDMDRWPNDLRVREFPALAGAR
jgi:protein gp37